MMRREPGSRPTAPKPVFWFVSGVYTVGGGEQWHGPFATYEDAKAEWGRRAWATVDDAHARYRIEKRIGHPPEAG